MIGLAQVRIHGDGRAGSPLDPAPERRIALRSLDTPTSSRCIAAETLVSGSVADSASEEGLRLRRE